MRALIIFLIFLLKPLRYTIKGFKKKKYESKKKKKKSVKDDTTTMYKVS